MDRSKSNAGAPEDEIEITPEMIEAGTLELASYDPEFESIEEAAKRVYRAMVLRQRHPLGRP